MGLDIEQAAEGIIIRQEHYLDEVEEIMLFDKRNRNSGELLSAEESREPKKVAGHLSWVASQTRPCLSSLITCTLLINSLTYFSHIYHSLMHMRFLCCYPHNQFQPVLDSVIICHFSQPPTGVDSLDMVSLSCGPDINSLPPFLYW